MTTLKIDIDNQSNAKALARFLRTLGYVKSVSIEKTPLSDEDLMMPGRAITDKDLDRLVKEMEDENDPGISTSQLEKEITQWNKGIYK